MIKRLKNTFLIMKQAGIYVPVTWYFVLFLAFGTLVFRWLMGQQQHPDNTYSEIFTLLLLVSLSCVGILLAWGLLSVSFSFLFFLIKKRRRKVHCKLESLAADSPGAMRQQQTLRLEISPLIKPLLGFVKLRVIYDLEYYSEKFSLAEKNRKNWSRLEGTYHWPLPQIREYRIDQVIVYFEDLFQFFSFPVTLDINDRFFTRPDKAASRPFQLNPRKTEETNVHIDEMKKVEGEHVNYKHFEANDDVRRIVWKIYAKNKELVVRMPEIMDPYASHLCLYASFHTAFPVSDSIVVKEPFLDYYKTIVNSTYEQLVKQGFEVQYIPDQPIRQNWATEDASAISRLISVTHWQQQQDISSYVKPEDAAIVLVSSLNDAGEVERLVSRYGNQISFVLVRLSNSMKQQEVRDWLQWLFVQYEPNTYERYRPQWQISQLRRSIIANEKKIAGILAAYEKSVVV
ncbi:DUF58 domain-containing protein [Filimonas effusa]|uniref:DUF58 domain-containing protein n=1 Tax=Filimonas effusa TaxID=2508721 RepID=A0A4Q1DE64_9BACT|nr:DUF58 domain-containing protein [Filimonas effusa]RXK87185.1 DUF58 domain-containing protein [Filimonas effusa]